MKILKRLNRSLLTGSLLLCVALCACKKKDRLSVSTFDLLVSPTSSTLLNGASLSLSASGRSQSGAVAVDPTWTVTPSTAGALAPASGTSVQFTAQALGDAIITATYDGVSATAQLAVVSYIPTTTNVLNIYTDSGLPANATLPTSGGLSIAEISTGYTSEGTKYQRATDATNASFWGVALPSAMNATSPTNFSAGTLKFDIRLARPMILGEGFVVKLEDSGVGVFSVGLSAGVGFDRTSTEWQSVSLPLSSYFTGGVNSASVDVPFLISVTAATPITFDIDAVRWIP